MRYALATIMILAAGPCRAQPQFRITTVAGSNFVGDGGSAASATLYSVEGLATDAAGNLYIADAADHRIRRVDRQGRISTIAGNGNPGYRGDGGPAEQAQLNSPYGIAFDAGGGLLLADYGNHRVRRIGADGVIKTVAGGDTLGVQFLGPRNIAVDSSGNLFVSDYLDHRIYRVATDGRISVVAGTSAAGNKSDGASLSTQLSYPAGLVVDRAGALYVADSGNHSVRRIAGGQVTTILGGPGSPVTLATPVGLAFDPDGSLYIADTSARRLFRRSPNGAVITVAEAPARDVAVDSFGVVYFGSGRQAMKLASASGAPVGVAGIASEPAVFENSDVRLTALQGPMGVAVDASGSIYIAEERLKRVRRVTADGLVQTAAGDGLVDPVAVAWDPVSGLRIADYFGNRVRGVLPGGNLYTVAGDGEPGYRGDAGPAAQSRLNRPRGAAFDREGNLYVADSLNHRIRLIAASGFISTVAGSGVRGFFGDGGPATQAQLNAPQGVAVDSLGNIYIADTGNNVVRRASPDGVVTTVAGTGIRGYAGDGGQAPLAALNLPAAVAVDAGGLLLIADTFNHRVRRVNALGTIETIAGDGVAGYFGDDGPAKLARLNAPTGLAVDSTGRIFIADFDNNRVRRLDPDATINALPPPDPIAAPAELTVMSAASLRTGPIAPGAILALFAAGIGPARAVQGELTGGRLPFTLAGFQVRIEGLPAAMFYAGPGQINVEAPRSLTPKEDVLVEVLQGGSPAVLAAARVEARAAYPALFTLGQGVGQALVVNEDGSLNSEDRPAARGSIVTLFATGDGETEPLGIDGVPSGNPPPRSLQTVQVQVGAALGQVLFAGRAPGFVGLFQVNVQLPGVFTPPGVRPLTLSVGRMNSQPGVTIAVK